MTLVINLFQTSSVLPMTKNFQNDSFLLVHGTGDGKLGHILSGLMLNASESGKEIPRFIREKSYNILHS